MDIIITFYEFYRKNVRQMCFECPFYCVSNTSISFAICRKYECLRTHRSHFVRQMCSETNVLRDKCSPTNASMGVYMERLYGIKVEGVYTYGTHLWH
jgi:hypothetical protein